MPGFIPPGAPHFNELDLNVLVGCPINSELLHGSQGLAVRDVDIGKRMVEDAVLEQVLDSYPLVTGRTVTDDYEGDFPRIEGSPDFVIGVDGKALGVELAQLYGADDAWHYFEMASNIAWKKHASYARRGLFRKPIVLLLHSDGLPIYDIERELSHLIDPDEFEGTGFAEVWTIDLSEIYYSPGHPFRRADMFCLKPRETFGFHRIGDYGRKPFG